MKRKNLSKFFLMVFSSVVLGIVVTSCGSGENTKSMKQGEEVEMESMVAGKAALAADDKDNIPNVAGRFGKPVNKNNCNSSIQYYASVPDTIARGHYNDTVLVSTSFTIDAGILMNYISDNSVTCKCRKLQFLIGEDTTATDGRNLKLYIAGVSDQGTPRKPSSHCFIVDENQDSSVLVCQTTVDTFDITAAGNPTGIENIKLRQSMYVGALPPHNMLLPKSDAINLRNGFVSRVSAARQASSPAFPTSFLFPIDILQAYIQDVLHFAGDFPNPQIEFILGGDGVSIPMTLMVCGFSNDNGDEKRVIFTIDGTGNGYFLENFDPCPCTEIFGNGAKLE